MDRLPPPSEIFSGRVSETMTSFSASLPSVAYRPSERVKAVPAVTASP